MRVSRVLDPIDGNVTVATSEQMAQLRRVVEGELGAQSRGVILGVLSGATFATMVNAWGMTLLRRRDLGRRRALGATRTTIITLLVGQVTVAALASGVVGTVAGLALLAFEGAPRPGAGYVVALILALTGTAVLAAFLPAIVAVRRDPLAELRVP